MTFVPIVPGRSTHASPNAEELNRRIQKLIREYQQNHPDTSQADVAHALRLAQMSSGGSSMQKPMLLLVLGILLLLGGVSAFLGVGLRGGSGQPLTMYMIAGIIVVVGLKVVIIKAQR